MLEEIKEKYETTITESEDLKRKCEANEKKDLTLKRAKLLMEIQVFDHPFENL